MKFKGETRKQQRAVDRSKIRVIHKVSKDYGGNGEKSMSNSFHRHDKEAQEDGKTYKERSPLLSLQRIIEEALYVDHANKSNRKDKGKSRLGEEEEVLRRGFSPT